MRSSSDDSLFKKAGKYLISLGFVIGSMVLAAPASAAESVPGTSGVVSSSQVTAGVGIVNHTENYTSTVVSETYTLSTGEVVTFKALGEKQEIQVFRNGTLYNTISFDELHQQIQQQADEQGISVGNAHGARNGCGVGMAIAGVANGALWLAAGFTAAPTGGASVAAAASVGGFVTSSILTVAGAFC
jgi:hypothetical protein